jgi:hypothetical protein
VSTTPALRLRRDRQPHIVGNVLAIAIGAVVAVTVLARGLMPGLTDTPQAPGIDIVKAAPACTSTTVLPNTC